MTEISKEYAEALFSLACEAGKEREMLLALEDALGAFALCKIRLQQTNLLPCNQQRLFFLSS